MYSCLTPSEGLCTEQGRSLQTQLAESKRDNNYHHYAVKWILKQACLWAREEMEHCSQGWSQGKWCMRTLTGADCQESHYTNSIKDHKGSCPFWPSLPTVLRSKQRLQHMHLEKSNCFEPISWNLFYWINTVHKTLKWKY